MKIHYIDFVEFAPLDSSPVVSGNAVGWQVGDLDAQLIPSCMEKSLELQSERYAPSATHVVSVDVETGRFAHIAQIHLIFIRG